MKVALLIVVAVATFSLIGGLEISFSPFRISIPYWYRSVAVILMILALVLYNQGERTRGYYDGMKKTIEYLKKSGGKEI